MSVVAAGKRSAQHGDGPGFLASRWLLLAGVLVVAGAGVALVASAPLDGPARSSLGGSLLTGVVVGAALFGFEDSLDRRRAAREEAFRRELYRGMVAAANDSLASLVSTHVGWLWFWFQELVSPTPDESEPAITELPPPARPLGWKGSQDTNDVRRALMWRAEVMGDNPSWWRNEIDLASTDAIYFVATDLAERFDRQPNEEEEIAEIIQAKTRTITRLAGIAQRLSESGAGAEASRIDAQVDSLRFGRTASYIPHLPRWGTEDYDYVIPIGSPPLTAFREEVAWLTAELRERNIRVDRDGDPIEESAPTAEAYRWQPLFSPSETARGAWDRRFESDSWFRRLMGNASSGLSTTKVGRLAGLSDQ
jgi:hypothetical protein